MFFAYYTELVSLHRTERFKEIIFVVGAKKAARLINLPLSTRREKHDI